MSRFEKLVLAALGQLLAIASGYKYPESTKVINMIETELNNQGWPK